MADSVKIAESAAGQLQTDKQRSVVVQIPVGSLAEVVIRVDGKEVSVSEWAVAAKKDWIATLTVVVFPTDSGDVDAITGVEKLVVK